MGTGEEVKDLGLGNDNSICDTTNQREDAAVPDKTLDSVKQNGMDTVCKNAKNATNGALSGVARHSVRSHSESECGRIPTPNLSRSKPRDKTDHNGMASPKNTDVEQQQTMADFHDDIFDGLPAFEEVKLPVPPDGGWGWVIVAVSFVCCAVVDGLCSVFGVLLPELVIYFQESSSTVSLAGSILAGGFLLSGPLASIIINCLGCRIATIIGAILTTVALVSSAWSSTVTVFILLFGGLGGVGLGLMYLPASVMVGYYFERRRGLAAGISSAGAGVGMLILSPLAAYLLEQYGWKGCLILIAGVCLQCTICGLLMRPLVPTLTVLRPEAFLSDEDNTSTRKFEPVSAGFIPNLAVIKENVPLFCTDATKTDDLPSEQTSTSSQNVNDYTKPRLSLTVDGKQQQSDHGLHRRASGVESCAELDLKNESICSNGPVAAANTLHVSEVRPHLSCQELSSCESIFHSRRSSIVRSRGSIVPSWTERSNSIIVSDTAVTPLMRKDIFYSGSLISLQNSISKGEKHVEPSVLSVPNLYNPTVIAQKSILSRAVHMLKEMMDISIMFNFSFLVICLANTFIQLGFFVPVVFLPAYGVSLGLSTSQAATLLAVMGASTMVGRALAGAIASLRCVNGLHLNNLTIICAGIVTVFVTLCTTFDHLIVYAFLFGLSVSGFVPMTTVFLVKYVGLDKLTNSFGLLCMVKGLSTMAGPPIAGALRDLTDSYDLTFYFAGAMFISSGLLFYILPLTQKPIALVHECKLCYCHQDEDKSETTSSVDYDEKKDVAMS